MNAAKGNGSRGRRCGLWGRGAWHWSHTRKALGRLRQAETFWRQSCSTATSQLASGSGFISTWPILGGKIAKNAQQTHPKILNILMEREAKHPLALLSLKEKLFIENSSEFDLIPTKGWCCDGDFLLPACIGRLRFPQPAPATSLLPLKPSWGALQRACAAKSACVFWHVNARLVGNFPLNPFIARIPVETPSISGWPRGARLGSAAQVTPHRQRQRTLLSFLRVQRVFKMKYWPQTPLWMAVRSLHAT